MNMHTSIQYNYHLYFMCIILLLPAANSATALVTPQSFFPFQSRVQASTHRASSGCSGAARQPIAAGVHHLHISNTEHPYPA
ncbi:hypothetical protein BGW36DRAFT_108535 [Talaromyces proteolyticus]|uniref:Secreted protein n=1 Tax=Talaromyces proteolyticus TaxID=1131652 RepID=A0AAD4Q3P3_9EURO|nr:uncharacterized protein BGW36DRAFT_108535 [Talaromyces proteolyticus]KAH8701932.1 hypothetical protein BGW36DRAFT_108535 [Talaromyces proteolyticus]